MIGSRGGFESLDVRCDKNTLLSFGGTVTH